MNLTKDHKKSTLFLTIYFAWWFYFAYSYFIKNNSSNFYLQSNANLFLISFAIMFAYWLILLFMVLINKGDRQTDFLILFGLVSSPLAITLFYILSEL